MTSTINGADILMHKDFIHPTGKPKQSESNIFSHKATEVPKKGQNQNLLVQGLLFAALCLRVRMFDP